MDEMENKYADSLSDNLVTLQTGLNELIRNAYLFGFKDGREFELKLNGQEAGKSDAEYVEDLMGELKTQQSSALLEAEKILEDYS